MLPILLEFPDSFETERLILRCARSGDGGQLNAAVLESMEHLRPWMPWADQAPSLQQSEAYSRKAQAEFLTRTDFTLRMVRKSDGVIIGSTGLHPRNWEVPSFEIGYWCRSSCQRQGYTTEAVTGVAAFAFTWLKARRLVICCDEKNVPSQRVALASGFALEGRLANEAVNTSGELRTTLVYARTA